MDLEVARLDDRAEVGAGVGEVVAVELEAERLAVARRQARRAAKRCSSRIGRAMVATGSRRKRKTVAAPGRAPVLLTVVSTAMAARRALTVGCGQRLKRV